jgi:hypothetical protein
MANKERGEIAVSLGGKDYRLRPTFQALAEIENRSGIGLVALARRFLAQDFGLNDVIAVLEPAIEAGGVKPPADLGALVVMQGIATFTAPIETFLIQALTGRPATAPEK